MWSLEIRAYLCESVVCAVCTTSPYRALQLCKRGGHADVGEEKGMPCGSTLYL